MYTYQIIPNEEIIILKMEGKISISELKDFLLKIKQNPAFSGEYAFVSDFRNADVGLSLEELRQAAEYFKKNSSINGKKACLVNRSIDTAKIILFRDYLYPDSIVSVFSTVEAASSCVGVDLEPFLELDIPVREDVYI